MSDDDYLIERVRRSTLNEVVDAIENQIALAKKNGYVKDKDLVDMYLILGVVEELRDSVRVR